MDFQKPICVVGLLLVLSVTFGSAGDIVHPDDVAPKRPGCDNNFVLRTWFFLQFQEVEIGDPLSQLLFILVMESLGRSQPGSLYAEAVRFAKLMLQVKIPTWINGVEDIEYVGVGARFGVTLESKEKHANHTRVVLADPPDCCSTPKNNLTGEVILVHRGNCSFTDKANIAESANATAILIINNRTELFKMVCENNETDLDIDIPAVMLPQDAGMTLENYLKNNTTVSVQLYSPLRPVVDIAEVFLWLMAVGTILCASYWSAWSAREAAIEQDKLLKDGSDEILNLEGVGSSGFVDINTTAAILFVVIASCFLVMLYKLMSTWFIEVLVVLFCIGGVEWFMPNRVVGLLEGVHW
uniref:PA domain-containing protein n=1 Tax=Fagus sylvatica TaxID=28930 RepID=A0A2N9GUL5_FAGSY